MSTNTALSTEKLKQDGMVNSLVLSEKPEKAMQEMMSTIDTLRTVYTEETDALQGADTMKFLEIQDRKIKAARDYKDGAEQLLKRKEEFKDIDPALRNKLVKMHEDFSGLATNNIQALDSMRKAVQRLGDRIMRAARDAASQDGASYSAGGDIKSNDRAVSIGVNESA